MIAGRIQAGFLVAPMAIALRSQGVPIKIVYLGHRYGSAVVVRSDGPIHSVPDLKGKLVAIPSRYSDERLILFKALAANGVPASAVDMVEMAPPDVPSALASESVDAFSMGEPFPSQAEIGGYGRVLFKAADYWPDFMSCVLVVRQDVIDQRPDAVQTLVDGIARSGLWLDRGRAERVYASQFVGRYYYAQPPDLLLWALTNPIDRVRYSPLSPLKADFDVVQDWMVRTGVAKAPIPFEDFVDVRFAEHESGVQPWEFRPESRQE